MKLQGTITNTDNNVPAFCFKAKISKQVMRRIDFELPFTVSKRYAKETINEKLKAIPSWGPQRSELVIAKNNKGNKCLGLKMPLDNGFVVSWPIEYLKGKTILSQLMNLHSSHLDSTEQTIKFLHSKYGLDVFEKAKITSPSLKKVQTAINS